MKKSGRLPVTAAIVLFVIYFSNVALGATGSKPVLGDIAEMLTLLASAILFAIGTLQMEAQQSEEQTTASEN